MREWKNNGVSKIEEIQIKKRESILKVVVHKKERE